MINKISFLTLCAIICAVVFFIPTAFSETYYIDYSNSEGSSSDANDGKSESNSWIHCPGDVNYSGSGNLIAGDIVYFKKGITYLGQITTISHNVTYTVTNWGTGDAIVDGTGKNACFEVKHSFITIDGGDNKNLIITGMLKHAGIWNYASSELSNSKFANLKIINIGDASSTEGIGIKIGGNDVAYTDYEISHCEMTNCYSYGIKISGRGVDSIEIHNNILEGNGYNPAGRAQINFSSNSGAGVQNVRCHDNVVRYGAEGANGINCNNTNNEIYQNEIYGNPGSGISTTPNYNKNYEGVIKIYGNKIYDQTDYGIIIGNSDSSRYAKIYNNIFANNGSYEINLTDSSCNNEFIYNTVYHYKSGHGIRIQSNCNNNILKNNIIFTEQGYAIYDSTGNVIEDYNCFFRETGLDVAVWAGKLYSNIYTYQTASNQGVNSIWTDPMIADTSTFYLSKNSPCIGAAEINVEITDDFYKYGRGDRPHLGAVHKPLNPPRNLKIVP